jgi:hypothetical protein
VRILRYINGKLFHNISYSVYGGRAPSCNTVAKWSKWFHKNYEDIENETCLARPATEKSSANIDQVRCLTGDESHLMIDEMEVETGISSDTIECIRFVHLKLKKETTAF